MSEKNPISLCNITDEQHLKALSHFCAQWDYWSFEETLSSLQKTQNNPQSYEFFFLPGENSPNWICGLLILTNVDTTEICYLFSLPESRKKGSAKKLFLYMLDWIKQTKSLPHSLFLEVRPHNEAARHLYESQGMTITHTRKKYYPNGDNALVYFKEVT